MEMAVSVYEYERWKLTVLLKTGGAGILLTHPYGIKISRNAESGEDVTIFEGTINSSVRSRKRVGA